MMLLAASLALAQSDPVVSQHWELLPSVQTDLLSEALDTNARVYGTAGFLTRAIFPLLDQVEDDVVLIVGGESNNAFDLLRIPGICEVSLRKLDSGEACIAHADMFSSTGGLVYGNKHLALFYGASFTGLYVPDIFISRGMMPIALTGMSYFQMLTAPVQTGPLAIGPGLHDLIGSSRTEYIVGLRGGYQGISLHAGFLGSNQSNGFFGNLTEERLRLLATAVLREELDLPFFLGGLVDSPLLERLLSDAEGWRPSLFARKYALVPPDLVVQDPLREGKKKPSGDLWSGHLGQTTPLLDVRLAMAVQPKVMLHEAVLVLHDPGYPGPATLPGGDAEGVHVRLSGGIIRMPELPWYGLDEATTPFLEGGINVNGMFELAGGYNSSEVLTQFPYARNSVQLRATWRMGMDQ
jgi:hypothetical protein